MSPFVKMYYKTVSLDFARSPGFHELAIELFGLRFVKTLPLRGQPAVAPMRQHCQGHVYIHVEPHLTGQTVEVKDIDAAAEAILDAMPAGIAENEGSGTGIEVGGPKEGRLGMPSAVHCYLPYGASVPPEGRGLIHLAPLVVAAVGDIDPCSAPSRGGEGLEATEEGGPPTPNRHKPNATLIEP